MHKSLYGFDGPLAAPVPPLSPARHLAARALRQASRALARLARQIAMRRSLARARRVSIAALTECGVTLPHADGDRLVFRHCRFLGWQDTILVNRGRHYFADCSIEGSVDFIFGGAAAYFDRCRVHCLADGYITAASTPKDQPQGYVFADCTVTGDDGVKTYLGRPWREFARTVFLRTTMSAAVRAEGWHNWHKPAAERTTFYAEFGSTGPGANDAARVPWAKPLTAAAAAALTPAAVLGGADGWNPATP